MAAKAPDSPEQLLERFKTAGWVVVDEGKFNWLVAQLDDDGMSGEPFVVPKNGEAIGFETMRQARKRLEGLPDYHLPIDGVYAKSEDS